MCPLQHTGLLGLGDEQSVGWAVAWVRLLMLSLPDLRLYFPGYCASDTRLWDDGLRRRVQLILTMLPGEHVWLASLRAGPAGEHKVEPAKEWGRPGLPGVQSLGSLDIFKVPMVGPHNERMLSSL